MKRLKVVAIWSLVFWGFFNGSLEWKYKWTCIKCLKFCWAPILVWIIRESSELSHADWCPQFVRVCAMLFLCMITNIITHNAHFCPSLKLFRSREVARRSKLLVPIRTFWKRIRRLRCTIVTRNGKKLSVSCDYGRTD